MALSRNLGAMASVEDAPVISMYVPRTPSILLALAIACSTGLMAGSSDTVQGARLETNAPRGLEEARQWKAEAVQLLHPDPLKALQMVREARNTARVLGDSALLHECLSIQATAQLALGLHEEHQRTLLEALQLSKAMGLAHAIARDLQGLAVAYRNNGLPERSVEASRDALAMLLPTGDEGTIGRAMLVHMHGLNAAGRYHDALRIGEQALARFDAINDVEGQARAWKQFGEVYAAQAHWGNALPFLVKASRILDTLGTDNDVVRLNAELARVHLGLGALADARACLDRAEQRAAGPLRKTHGIRLRELHYELALTEGRWKDALSFLQIIRQAEDSMRNARNEQRIAALHTMYDLQLKEIDNEELRGMVEAHAQAILATQRANTLLKSASLALLCLLVLTLFFGVRYRRMLRRLHLKNDVVRQQAQEIHAKNLELERQNLRLTETLLSEEEKELLLKEIHHRVKNNLQVVDSLLGLQFGHIADQGLKEQFHEARGRIRSMALVHELIYRGGDLRQQQLGQYLVRLGELVLRSHGLQDRVKLVVNAAPVPLTIEQLMPIGLVANELLTNSAKHAFPTGTLGTIHIDVVPDGDGHRMDYRDDGRGLHNAKERRAGAFGLELMRVLAMQVNGNLEVCAVDGPGVHYILSFAPDGHVLRVAS